jgi:hypothetical protein
MKRTLAVMVATAVLVLLATACSGTPSSSRAGGSSQPTRSGNSPLLAYAQCVRSHGVPNFPDPQPGAVHEKIPSAQQLGVGSSQLGAAQSACQHLLPVGADDQFPAAEVPLLLSGMRRFSQCMRAHGVPNWPDPSVDSQGRPIFNLSGHGFSRQQAHARSLNTKMGECGHLLPHALGGIPLG